MPVYFSGGAGRAIVLQDPAAQGTVTLAALDPSFDWVSQRSLITRATFAHQVNFQVSHSLGNDVYVYVFGDRIGQVTISGLSLAADCEAGSNNSHGAELAYAWYQDNRLAARQAPVRVTVGVRTVIEGFVIGLGQDVVSPDSLLMSFALTLMTLPEKK
jgi:hypothetical protein